LKRMALARLGAESDEPRQYRGPSLCRFPRGGEEFLPVGNAGVRRVIQPRQKHTFRKPHRKLLSSER
jgi:hypothetical protein